MGQFDSSSAAALAQIRSDIVASSPVDATVSKIAGIGSKILDLGGFLGAATLTDLIQELKRFAANKDEANLVYFGEALVEDIARLYRLNDGMRKQVAELLNSEEFHRAVENATLHVIRTNVEVRIQRIAILIANGVKSRDLEPESLDDMMRASVELKELDVRVLEKIYDAQSGLLKSHRILSSEWAQQVAFGWAGSFSFLDSESWKGSRSSLARLESFGFIQQISTNVVGTGDLRTQPFGLLYEGAKFCEQIREIEKANSSK